MSEHCTCWPRRTTSRGRRRRLRGGKVVYNHVATSHAFDAAVVAKDESGKVRIEKKHEEPPATVPRWGSAAGLATGAVVALFPAVGFLGALAVGGGARSGAGRGRGARERRMDRDDLKVLGEASTRATPASSSSTTRHRRPGHGCVRGATALGARKSTNVSMEQLAADVREALAAAVRLTRASRRRASMVKRLRCRLGKHRWRSQGRAPALTYVCEVCGKRREQPPPGKTEWPPSAPPGSSPPM